MTPTRIVIHCTASPNGKPYSREQCDADHRANGWRGIGYHGLVQPDGHFDQGRALDARGAGVKGHNEGSLHLAFVGTDRFSLVQLRSGRSRLKDWQSLFQIPEWEIWGHRQFDSAIVQGKSCPGIDINRFVAWHILQDDRAMEEYMLEAP